MSDEAPEYGSPKRCLARCFRLSRDRWKLKATDRLGQIKALKVKARDLHASRDLWKLKALHYEQILRDNGLLPASALGPDQAGTSRSAASADRDVPAPAAQAEPTPPPGSKKKTTRHGRR